MDNSGTTGRLVSETLTEKLGPEAPSVVCMLSGPLGGDFEIGGMIAEGKIDMLVFFCDNLIMQGHQNDVMVYVSPSLYNIPFATNRSTADFIISSPLYTSKVDPTHHPVLHRLLQKPQIVAQFNPPAEV